MMMMRKMFQLGGTVAVLILLSASDARAHHCAGRTGDDFVLGCSAARSNVYAIDDPAMPDADNMWCAYDRCSYDPRSNPACVVLTSGEIDACIKSGDFDVSEAATILLEDGSEFGKYLDDDNIDDFIKGWGLGGVMPSDGQRYFHMRPSEGKAAACQAWMQRKMPSAINSEVTTFAFDSKKGRCYFFEVTPSKGEVSVKYGGRHCDCAEVSDSKCPKGTSDNFVEECIDSRLNIVAIDDSDLNSGRITDADNAWCAYDRCFEGGSRASSACVIMTSDELATCYGMNTLSLLAVDEYAVDLYDAEGELFDEKYLSDDNIDEFIEVWGLNGTIQEGTPRYDHMKPSNGPFACQAWLQRMEPATTANRSRRVINEKANYFMYDGLEKACYFLAVVPGFSSGEDAVTGPRYCNDCGALGFSPAEQTEVVVKPEWTKEVEPDVEREVESRSVSQPLKFSREQSAGYILPEGFNLQELFGEGYGDPLGGRKQNKIEIGDNTRDIMDKYALKFSPKSSVPSIPDGFDVSDIKNGHKTVTPFLPEAKSSKIKYTTMSKGKTDHLKEEASSKGKTVSDVKEALGFLMKKTDGGQVNWRDEEGLHAVQWRDKKGGESVQFVDGDKLIQSEDW